MKSKTALILAASMMSILGGTSLAGESKVVYNNRNQVTATVTQAPAKTAAAPAAVKQTQVWNNRGQLIGVVWTPAR